MTLQGASPGSGSLQIMPGTRQLAGSQKDKSPVAPVALQVTTLKNLTLPQFNSDAGIFSLVFLHETPSPTYRKGYIYNPQDDLTAMNYIRNVLDNRRSRRFDLFGFSQAPTLEQMLHNPTQFDGLSTYPNLPHSQLKNIEDILSIANDDNHHNQLQFARHVENALTVATQIQTAPDPSPRGLYAWRTARHGSPGSHFSEFATVADLTFYTLADDVPPPRHGAKN